MRPLSTLDRRTVLQALSLAPLVATIPQTLRAEAAPQQVHIATLLDGKIKPEYVTQCQYSMWVTGLDRWEFCSYDHRMRGAASNRLVVIPQYRDAETMARFDEEIPKFISEMDEALERLGFKFFDQWRAI